MCGDTEFPAGVFDDLWILCYPCGWPVGANAGDSGLLLYLSEDGAIAGAELQNKIYDRGCRPARLKIVVASLVANDKLSRKLPTFNTEG
jgi:hypothetical protein